MKIVVGSLQCEANSFSTDRAGIADFEVHTGEAACRRLAACKIFKQAGANVVPLIFASALPTGMVRREAFEHFKGMILSEMQKHPDMDGIYLYLHGSMFVERLGSGEEALLLAVRDAVGNGIPISVACDFHANFSRKAIGCINALFGFRTAPHTDQDETEMRAARALLHCIKAGALPLPQIVRVPLLIGDGAVTAKEPFQTINEELSKLDGDPDVISSAVMNGQPWFDTSYSGGAAVVCRLSGAEKALRDAYRLAGLFWEGRENLCVAGAMEPEEAVRASLENREGVLFVNDSGDNTTAGATGAGTLMLKKYMDASAKGVLVCGIFDRENTGCLLHLPEGTKVHIVLNKGMHDKQQVEIALDACLKKLGRVCGWAGEEAGEGVLLSAGGVDILLSNARAAFTSPAHFAKMGIRPLDYRVIVLKMGYLFPKLHEISEKMIFALTPGTSSNDFSQLEYKNLKGKRYPREQDMNWQDVLQMQEEEEQ